MAAEISAITNYTVHYRWKIHLLKCCTQVELQGTCTLFEYFNSMLLFDLSPLPFIGKVF